MGLFRKKINILYHDADMTDVVKIKKGDWFDLRCQSILKVKFEDTMTFNPGSSFPTLARNTQTTEIEPFGGFFEDRVVDFFKFEKGDFLLINLGVSMELPKGYEAILAPRGSTFKSYGLIQTNSLGVVDNDYKGHDDIWFMPAYALRDGFIIKDERVCQFRIQKTMPYINFKSVTNLLKNENRSGHGSTGTK